MFGVLITWDLPSQAIDGFELEAWSGRPPFKKLHEGLLSPRLSSTELRFSDTVPDATRFMFRIRTVIGKRYSPYSVEVPYTFGVRSPNNFRLVMDAATATNRLSWDAPAFPGTKPRLVRESPGPPTVLVDGDSGISSCLDPNLSEGTDYVYRLVFENSGIESDASYETGSLPVPAPANVQVRLDGNIARLSWTNLSRDASLIKVLRASGTSSFLDLATLHPTATGFEDKGLPLGFYSYRIQAVVDPHHFGESDTLSLRTLEDPLDLKFKEERLRMPDALEALRSGNGFWRLLGGFPSSYNLYRQHADGWSSQSLAINLTTPGFLLDDAGEPHTLHFDERQPDGSRFLKHTWYDGLAWKTEQIGSWKPSYSSSRPYLLFAMGTGGQMGGLWTEKSEGGSEQLRFIQRKGETWLNELVPLTPTSLVGIGGLCLDTENCPFFWYSSCDGAYLLHRDTTGRWVSLPFAPPMDSGSRLLEIVQVAPQGPAVLHILYTVSQWMGDHSETTYHLQTFRNGVWETPELLPMKRATLLPGKVSNRLLVLERSDAGFIAWDRLGLNSWRPSLLPTLPVLSGGAWPQLTAEDRLCFLQYLGDTGSGSSSYMLLTELPTAP